MANVKQLFKSCMEILNTWLATKPNIVLLNVMTSSLNKIIS